MSRFVRPEVTTLTLVNGDTLVVKKYLTAGEHRAMVARLSYTLEDGTRKVDRIQAGIATVLAYLVDWSLTDDTGRLVAIRGASPDEMQAAVDHLFPDEFKEIRDAIDAHETAMAQARDGAKKKIPAGATASDPTSTSLSVVGGASTGSGT